MADGGTQLTLRLPAPLTLGNIVPFRVYADYKGNIDTSPTFGGEVAIRGDFHQVDLEEKKLSIEWEVSCVEKLSTSPTRDDPEPSSRKPFDYAAGVYAVDVYLADDAGNAFPYDPAKSLGWDKFETVHNVQALGRLPEPLDSHSLQLFAFAINPADNLPVDIARFSVPSSPNGFTVSSRFHSTYVPNQFTYNTGNGSETIQVNSRALSIVIQYSSFTLVFTGCMFITNWVFALASLCITLSAMKKGRVTWPALALNSTMVLVVHSIRKLYLCPLPFGTVLDTVGFFSQGAILSFCSLALVYALIVQPKAVKRTLSRVGRKI